MPRPTARKDNTSVDHEDAQALAVGSDAYTHYVFGDKPTVVHTKSVAAHTRDACSRYAAWSTAFLLLRTTEMETGATSGPKKKQSHFNNKA